MQIPNSTGPTSGDPFSFKDGKLMMPGIDMVAIERQEPRVKQFNLALEPDAEELNTLLGLVFKKKALIWSMDKAFNREGDCIVVVFYSNIKDKIIHKTQDTQSFEAVTVGHVNQKIIKEAEAKEDAMFDEFIKFMDLMKQEENVSSNDDTSQILIHDD